jgi:hypothetical protein
VLILVKEELLVEGLLQHLLLEHLVLVMLRSEVRVVIVNEIALSTVLSLTSIDA